MKKSNLLLIFLISLTLSGCNKIYETPALLDIEVSENACKNLIIFIGDGMGLEHINAGQIVSNKTYAFTSWKNTFSDTCSYSTFGDEDVELTDSAAGGTAIATGVTTLNGRVGIDSDGNYLATILDYAKAFGKSTGVVSTDTITGATPADFSGHALNRSDATKIIDTQIQSNIDLFIGQNCDDVSKRKKDIKKGGYTYYSVDDSLDNISKKEKVWIQYNFEENGGSNSLKDATKLAIDYLSSNDKGYVLMVEQAHIDKFSHNKDFVNATKAVNSLNDTVDYAVSTSDETAIIISADHETGGLSVSRDAIYDEKYNDAYYFYRTSSHTNTYVPVYIHGFDVNFAEFSIFNRNDLVKNKNLFNIALYAITNNKLQ